MKKKILLADEDVSARKMVARVLETADYLVTQVSTWEEAVADLNAAPADLAVLDLKSSEPQVRDSLELFSQRQPRVPVILLTAWPDHFAHSFHAAGALLAKPLDLALLLETIERLLAPSEPQTLHRSIAA